MSPKDDAEIRLRVISGSCMHNTSRGTAPASTTCCDNSVRGVFVDLIYGCYVCWERT